MMKNLLIVLFLMTFFAGCQPEKDSFLKKIKLTELNGAVLNSKQFEGKIVILNLWATWCAPCIREMPDLIKMQSQLPEDFVLILASDEEMEKIKSFTINRPFDLSFMQIQNNIESLGVYSLPTTFIIDKNGMLIETLVGARKWNSPEQIKKLKTYLK